MVTFQLETRARGRSTFQDTPSEPLDANRRNPCRNGSNTPRSADRRLRDGPRRRYKYPWTIPGGSWSMEIRGLAQGGACPFPSKCGGWDRPGFVVATPCIRLVTLVMDFPEGFSTLCRIDLPLNGDIAEFCPCAGNENSLAVGTYELVEVTARKRCATIRRSTNARAGRRSSNR